MWRVSVYLVIQWEPPLNFVIKNVFIYRFSDVSRFAASSSVVKGKVAQQTARLVRNDPFRRKYDINNAEIWTGRQQIFPLTNALPDHVPAGQSGSLLSVQTWPVYKRGVRGPGPVPIYVKLLVIYRDSWPTFTALKYVFCPTAACASQWLHARA